MFVGVCALVDCVPGDNGTYFSSDSISGLESGSVFTVCNMSGDGSQPTLSVSVSMNMLLLANMSATLLLVGIVMSDARIFLALASFSAMFNLAAK